MPESKPNSPIMLLHQHYWVFSLGKAHPKMDFSDCIGLLALSQTNNKYNIKNLINIRKTKYGREKQGNSYKNQVKRGFLVIYNK
jgi:hypothetical protein